MCILHEVRTLTTCPRCGAPSSPHDASCAYCDGQLGPQSPALLQPPEPPHIGRLQLAHHTYLVLGQLARGHHSQVYLARRHALLSELVLLKVGPLEAEWQALQRLRDLDGFLAQVLPQPVARHQNHFAYRWRSGFLYTLAEVARQYPRGVEPQTMVWMANRLLDQLARVHSLGFVHGQLQADHMLIHPRDHALLICGWSACKPGPPNLDLKAALPLLQRLLGPAPGAPWKELFPKLARLASAHEVQQELQRVARATFGPPRYHPFHMK